MSQIYNISSLIYYDNFKESYYPILTINKYPSGPLSSLIKQIRLEKLSPFIMPNTNYCQQLCLYAIKSINCDNELMNPDDIQDLYEFLLTHNYNINYEFTNLINKTKNNHINNKKLIMYITYVETS